MNSSRLGYIIKGCLLVLMIALTGFLIYHDVSNWILFFSGYLTGLLSLMVLREWLWNLHRIAQKEKDNG